jgi:hypothetical protein
MTKRSTISSYMLGLSLFMSSGALASTCSISDVTTSTACIIVSGNNENQNVNTIISGGLFGISNWVELASSVGAGSTVGPLTAGAGTTSGTWSVPSFGHTDAFLVVKGGNYFAAYLLDTHFTSGTWSTLGLIVGHKNHPSLSHLALYEGGLIVTNSVPIPTPLPGTVLLFGSVLAGAMIIRNRRERQTEKSTAA